MIPATMKKSFPAVLVTALLLAMPLPAVGADLTQEEVLQEADRYKSLGGVYEPKGFPEFPSQETPFYGHPGYGYSRLTRIRHRGQLLYHDKSGALIGHSFCCGRMGAIYVELWLPGGDKGMLPFAWQDPALLCRQGGEPSDGDPLYLDITGDGRPEVKFASVGKISRMTSQNGIKVRIFQEEIIPVWVRKRLGRGLKESSSRIEPGTAWIEPVYRNRNWGR